jgi:hypothetical protein
MITFNSIDRARFNANSAEFHGVEKERADIVTAGRLLMMERNGKDTNAMRLLEKKTAAYSPIMDENTYAQTNRNTKEKLFLYAASRTCSVSGEIAPASYEDFLKNQKKFMRDQTFLKVLAGIIRDIITPVLPVTMSNALSYLAETVNVPLGETYELDIASNDIFVFEDDSWGASRSKPSNYLYTKTTTLNPTPRTCKVTIKWYQMVGNNVDLGQFFNSIAAGMVSKITALVMAQMAAAANNATLLPANLQFTNTSANWVTAASRVSALNGAGYTNAIAIGHPSALTKALPSGVVNASTVNLDAALATMLGVEWARYGYLGEYMGVRLMPLVDAIVPGTQNTSMISLVPTDRMWILASNGLKPVYIGMEEGTPIEIQLDPRETGDMTLDIITTMRIDAKAVFGSKLAQITA